MRHLAVDWLALGRRIGARDDVAGAGANLLGRWAEPHRAYHDLAHLDEVLTRVGLLAGEADDADAVRLAAWFHDAVYDPTAADNEERSAWLATTVLHRLQVAEPTVALVAREPLFRTAYGREHWELAARANVQAELAGLDG